VPAYLVLQRSGHVSIAQSLLAGFSIAFSMSLIVVLLGPNGPGNYAMDSGGSIMIDGHLTAHGWWKVSGGCLETGALGTAIGLFFWLIAYWLPRRR
jgi:hypothetical protein